MECEMEAISEGRKCSSISDEQGCHWHGVTHEIDLGRRWVYRANGKSVESEILGEAV